MDNAKMNQTDDHTLEDHKLWNLIDEAWDALSAHFEPAVEALTKDSEMDRHQFSLLMAVLTCEPEAITPADLMVRNPYTAVDEFQNRLNAATHTGYLEEVEPGSFQLSKAGRRETQRLIGSARSAMVKADPLPEEDSSRLARLLDRLVRKCLETPPPPETWSIQASYKLMPEIDPPLPFIEQAITCLFAYRDDAHLAAWQFTGISATGFETLSLLWRNEANSLDEVMEKLAQRGHPREIYERALTELMERNFVTGTVEELMVTNDGRLLRNKAEEETNRFFFSPWSCLSYREKTDLAGLLIRLKEGLRRRLS